MGCAARYKNGDRGQTYNFSRVFGGDTAQEAFYQATAAPMVRQLTRVLQSSVLMAYGISAAGKTHTIEARRLRQPPCSLASRMHDSKYAHSRNLHSKYAQSQDLPAVLLWQPPKPSVPQYER